MLPFRTRTPSPSSSSSQQQQQATAAAETPSSLDDDDINDREQSPASMRRDSSASFWEYSDTTHDSSPVAAPKQGITAATTTTSAFRMRQDTVTKSMRTVRFDPNQLLDDDDDDDDDVINDDDDDEEKQQQLPYSRISAKQQQQHQSKHKLPTRRSQRHAKKSGTTTQHHQHHHHQHHSNKHRKKHFSSGASSQEHGSGMTWMKQLAYSFRTPSPKYASRKHGGGGPAGAAATAAAAREYPHVVVAAAAAANDEYVEHNNHAADAAAATSPSTPPPRKTTSSSSIADRNAIIPTETAPLLYKTSLGNDNDENNNNTTDFVAVAAAFLQDYEANRPPTLISSRRRVKDITPQQLQLYQFRYDNNNLPYKILLAMATVSFFGSSFLEGFYAQYWYHRVALTVLNVFAVAVYAVELWIRQELQKPVVAAAASATATAVVHYKSSSDISSRYHSNSKQHQQQQQQSPPPDFPTRADMDHAVRTSRSHKLVQPLILFGIVLTLENLARLLVVPNNSLILFTSLFKPLVLYYSFSQARDALEALRRIMRLVVRVILMELLLILMFAAVACRLFQKYDSFHDLSTAWLSLFELATTVVNPSLWMPMYAASKASAFYFIFFIVTSVFYLHSLVLSVVFQTYIHAATEIHQRSSHDREDAVELAYVALKHCAAVNSTTTTPYGNSGGVRGSGGGSGNASSSKRDVIPVSLVRDTLQLVRPHYSAMKINALCEIVAPSNQTTVDFPTFRTKIRQALNASIRTARSASPMAMTAELVAVIVALVNFVYVLLVSSDFYADWFEASQEWIGCAITVVAGFELMIRFNPFRIPDFTPLTRLNATFDGVALVAALVSAVGVVMHVTGHKRALEYILMGRAMDIFRIMRFFQIFRDIVRRSSDVFPALIGPVILVLSTMHVFVYLGIALWGGAISTGSYGDSVTYLYDLNNFNSYQEGVVTMFQVMVVNDWNQIAHLFTMASRCSSPYVVYPFFVVGNLVGVSIMLNVLTAFFVETFVTKVNDDTDGPAEATAMVHKEREYSIKTSENSPLKRILSANNMTTSFHDNGHDADSEGSSDSELYEFDVYEREGYDRIMQTVGNAPSDDGDFARKICSYLEIFESLAPGRETVGWLVCDQHTLERFGNARFQTKAANYLEDNELHGIVSSMHSELLALATRASFQDRSLIRRFPHRNGKSSHLEISASLLRRHPVLSLFVSREIEL